MIERDRIREEIAKVAFGEAGELSGRELSAKVAALRKLEWLTRDDDGPHETSEERLERLDYPVGPTGKFDPSGSAELWAVDMAWRWQAGDAREAKAIAHWEQNGGRRRWDLGNRPFARSRWEQDQQPWRNALAEVERVGER